MQIRTNYGTQYDIYKTKELSKNKSKQLTFKAKPTYEELFLEVTKLRAQYAEEVNKGVKRTATIKVLKKKCEELTKQNSYLKTALAALSEQYNSLISQFKPVNPVLNTIIADLFKKGS